MQWTQSWIDILAKKDYNNICRKLGDTVNMILSLYVINKDYTQRIMNGSEQNLLSCADR